MGLTRPRYSSIQDTDYKQSVRVATTEDVGNLLATGNMINSIDEISLSVNDRILVKNQTDEKQNGIYFVIDVGSGSNGTWRRSLDADTSLKVTSGMTTTVSEGTINANKTFKLTTADPITLGVSNLVFVDPFVVTAGAGGANTYVQFNDIGAVLGGSPGFTFNKFSNLLTVSGNISAGAVTTNLLVVNGNVSAESFDGNLTTADISFVNGRIFDGNAVLNIASGTSNIRIYSSDNIAVSSNGVANVVVIGATSTTLTGNLLPSANLTYNLGSPTQRWATGYFAGNTLDLGGAQISVDTQSGVFTFAPGTGHDPISFGATESFNPAGDVSIGGNLSVTGTVYFAGNTTTISTNNVVLNDSLIYLANNNPTDFLDIGFVGKFTRSSLAQNSGFARDATDGVWKLFEGVEPTPTTTIDFGSASYSTALIGNLVTRSNVTVGGNLRLGGALLTSAGQGGTSGQFLTSTGTNLAWVDLQLDPIPLYTASATVPLSAKANDIWYDTVDDIVFKYIDDGTNSQWVDTTSPILNTNIAAIVGTSLTITGEGTVTSGFTAGTISLNAADNATAIFNSGTNGVGNIGASGSSFNTAFVRATSASYADLAELYRSDDNYLPGTVVIFGGDEEITISKHSHDVRVAGVISTQPAYIMNNSIDGLAVALQGRVPCRVQGPVTKGQLLVASNLEGVAQAVDYTQYVPGCAIGKSLETIENQEVRLIEIVIGRI
jgi:hypothetical protein